VKNERVSSFLKWSSRSKEAFAFALVCALCATLGTAGGLFLSWKTSVNQKQRLMQEEAKQNAALLSNQVHSEMLEIESDSTQVIEDYLTAAPTERKNTVFVNPDISDVGIWEKTIDERVKKTRRKNPIGTSDQSAVEPEFKKVYQARNSKFIGESLKLGDSEKEIVIDFLSSQTPVKKTWMRLKNSTGIVLFVPIANDSDKIGVVHSQFNRLKGAFETKDGFVSALLDSSGVALISSNLSTDFADSPLFTAMATSSMEDGQMGFDDAKRIPSFGAFSKLKLDDLGIITFYSELDESKEQVSLKNNSKIYLLLIFGLCFLLGFNFKRKYPKSANESQQGEEILTINKSVSEKFEYDYLKDIHPRNAVVVVMHGSIQKIDDLMDVISPEDIAESVNEVLKIVSFRVKFYSGLFERSAGVSFAASWGLAEDTLGSSESPYWKAVKCATDIRRDFAALNELRKTDGDRALHLTLGIVCGREVIGKIGTESDKRMTAVGGTHASAKALDELAMDRGVDILVSQDVWQHVDKQFLGERAGEAKLTSRTGLITYYCLNGYRNELGEEFIVETPYSGEKKVDPNTGEPRWRVNNGSQIVGPWTASEIAGALYSQELDFDSECWAENTGESFKITSGKIFSGSNDENATLWVYDGQTIHGPLSSGFLQTALICGAIPETSHVCSESTVQGWQLASDWRAKMLSAQPVEEPSLDQTAA